MQTQTMRKGWTTLLLVTSYSALGCGGDVATDATGGASDSGAATFARVGASSGNAGTYATGGSTGANVAGTAAGGSSSGTNSVPKNHRSQDVACPEQRGAGLAGAYPGNECTQDSDCTAGINGRCISTGGPLGGSIVCSYDTCFSDSDCSDHVPCICRESTADSAANHCVEGGNCRIDSNCGSGGFCSPSLVGTLCGYDQSTTGYGYYCHTPQDSCLNDSDCESASVNSPHDSSVCAYNPESTRWSCATCYGWL